MVEQLVGQISANALGAITKPQGFDLNDSAFENLLQKAMETGTEIGSKLQMLGSLGQPAGLIIEPFDKISEVQPIGQENNISTADVQIKDVDLGTDYFSHLLKESPSEHKGLMNAAKKYASAVYKTFGKTLVEDLTDLAKDVKLLS